MTQPMGGQGGKKSRGRKRESKMAEEDSDLVEYLANNYNICEHQKMSKDERGK